MTVFWTDLSLAAAGRRLCLSGLVPSLGINPARPYPLRVQIRAGGEKRVRDSVKSECRWGDIPYLLGVGRAKKMKLIDAEAVT